jgi:molybdate transport system regulatory protein
MEIKFKVWLEEKGKTILSFGKYRLLKEIERTGSIKRAAENLNIPYKKAHSYIKLIEERIGKKIFTRERGVGTKLTPEGKRLIETYERILEAFEQLKERLQNELNLP